MKLRLTHLILFCCLLLAATGSGVQAQGTDGKKLAPPPPAMPQPVNPTDTAGVTLWKVRPTVPMNFNQLMDAPPVADLKNPSNITTVAEFDPVTGNYIIHTRLGETDLVTPFMLTKKQYEDWQLKRSMEQYYRLRNAELAKDDRNKEPFNIFDMNFSLGPLEKIFGPGGVKLKTTGSVQLTMGVKSNKTDNPTLSISARRKTYFDFDQKIQATVAASVGDRLKFNMTYNTDATFDFDSKNLKLGYEGGEDDIVQSIEAGNVSMTTGSSLIRGATALFGFKTKLQFGKLTVTGLVSQQNSESTSVSSKGGSQATEFSISAIDYDQNRHFFLAHYFRRNYDRFASRLPLVTSGINISRVQVWITNKTNNYNESRNIVAFMDLGENADLACSYWEANPSATVPSNTSNDLLATIKTDYPDARSIASVTQALEPLSAMGVEGGRDYEKVESARLLSPSEYILNSALGYISLNTELRADEVLAVAFEYTYQGQVYQVGEFSDDITSTNDCLYVKMLKSTTVAPRLPMWRLMMKNVYSLGGYASQIQSTNFKLQIKYLSDTTGTAINYLPVGDLANKTLLQVMNLDRLDSNREGNPDGFFDFIDGYTILPSKGKVIFPVAEPFGSHLEQAIGNRSLAERYVYPELYDSTQVIARQFSDKNKFMLTGSYQASGGAQIRLNAMNVPRGSVVVTAGGVTLTENSDYTVDYAMGIVTITNQSIIDSGQNISVSLENQSTFSMQRKTLVGLDLNYKFNRDFNIGATVLHYSEKSQTEKVNIGDEVVRNTMWGVNLSYNTEFQWLTNALNWIPTVNATAPSKLSVTGEFAQLVPQPTKTGSSKGSSYVDDFEATQSGIDLRSPYAWQLASTPYDPSASALFPEAALSNNTDYGKNRALLNWYYIDRMFTQRNSSLCPSYIKSDLDQLSNPYVREVTSIEIFPGRQLTYGESSVISTLNLSFYPTERGPYNLDADNIDPDGGALLNPEKRWGGIMRKLDNTNFEQSNIEYVQFWMMNPFLDPENPNTEGGDLYFNFGEISEDILKDGLKSYENGIPYDGNDRFLEETVWGRVSKQPSLTYSFDNNTGSRKVQDVGLDGINTADEFGFDTYAQFVQKLRNRLSPATVAAYEEDRFSPLNDPAGDNYHFYRGHDYDEERLGILERYKRYNGVEGNSLSPEDADDNLYQSSRATPDVEDINQDNTLNEYERYFQYRVSIRPEDLEVGRNYITDKQVSYVPLRNGQKGYVEWYQFKIPLQDWERKVGSISDFSAMRFVRMFMTGFRAVTHLRFATLELVRGEWRNYKFNLNNRADTPAEGELDVSVVNIEENAGRTPVNYVLPPGVSRLSNPGESQIVQLNEQSMSMKVEDLQAGDARGVYRDMQHDLRNYKRLQMWVHAEALIDNLTDLRSGQLSLFVRLGSDVKANYYEYEIPLTLTPPGRYNGDYNSQREIVWPLSNRLDFELQQLVNLKRERNREQNAGTPGVSFNKRFSGRDPENEANTITVIGNPSLSDVRVMLIGVRNTSPMTKSGTVWVNELKVTDFNEEGGWAAKANVNLSMSDIATFNFGAHIETAGFGGVDQSLNERRMDDYQQLNFAMQIDAGRFLPEKAKLHAPIYFSTSRERITPQYNPLDQDVKLSDALDACVNEAQRDSIKAYAVEQTTVQSFSISGLKFDVKSKNPKPWDPANFTANFSFNKQKFTDPTTEYQNTNDYRGSLSYNYSPFKRGVKPFSAAMKGKKGKGMKFLADWEFNYLPGNISFLTTMSRYYYEQQVRSEIDDNFQLPVSVSKNFLWDRQLNISWNLTKSLNFTFNSNTSARIEETAGAVNRRLFPDRYREWKDTVLSSIRKLGTPWSYNQTFTGSYKAPFNQIPATDWLTASASYNATYQWDRGATVDGYSTGNAIANQATLTADGRVNLEGLFNKVPYLKKVNQRFGGSASARNVAAAKRADRPKRFERTLKLKEDTSLVIKHNLKVPKVKVTAATTAGQPFEIETRKIDDNSLEVLTRGSQNLKFTIVEVKEKPKKNVWGEIAAYTTRLIMSPRSVNVHFRTARTMSIPLWRRSVGAAFGQSHGDGPLAPGLDFAFGFAGESFVERAKERGWLITDDGQTSPANMTNTNELRAEMSLEPIKGMKITLTTNRTDNRTRQVQFMYDNMPVSRSGNFTMTHVALASALRTSKASDGYYDPTFQRFLDYIPLMAARVQGQYAGTRYPTGGFMAGHAQAGKPFNPQVGTVSTTSSDVLIPAFLAAYTGKTPGKQHLSPFPSFAAALPNWKLTYDGLINLGKLRNIFKSVQITHAYQCTYTVGSYSGYLNWIAADGSSLGFTLDELSGQPIPSSPYNIASVAIRESFAPLAGLSVTLKNDIRFSAEYKDSRTLTLNSSAGQLVEARQQGITVGAGWKIANFNSVLKIKGKQTGVSNDLNINADFSYAFSQALIRRIESNYTQATSGTRNFSVQASANYSLSRRITLGLYFDHQVNTPLVSTSAYPTSNTSFGFNVNLSLAR